MNKDKQPVLGRMNTMHLTKRVDFGYYLDGGPLMGEVLLPNGEVPDGVEFDHEQDVEVFLYLDQQERVVATMKKPLAQVGDFAYLEVSWVNNFGAFLNWGPMKDLFVPFREQKMKMVKGQKYIVHVHMDEDSHRIMASAKVEKWLNQNLPHPLPRRGDRVECLVSQKTDIGFKLIFKHPGLLTPPWEGTGEVGLVYDTHVFCKLHTGDCVTAYVDKVRPDGKVDLTLQAQAAQATADFSETLLRYLKDNGGTCGYGDKSPAEDIYDAFGVSKKLFKKAIGDLYKRQLITILSDGGLKLTD